MDRAEDLISKNIQKKNYSNTWSLGIVRDEDFEGIGWVSTYFDPLRVVSWV